MKKKGILLAFCALLATVSCKKDNLTIDKTKYYDFDKVIVSDYELIGSMYQDFMFYEANALFSDSVSNLTKPEIVSMQTIFQVQDTVVLLDHNKGEIGNKPQITKITDHMIGDMQIFIDDIPVSFAKAWELLLKSDIPTPTGNTMTFRDPLSPPFDDYPSYIFTTDGGQHIRVYSGDGRVEYFE